MTSSHSLRLFFFNTTKGVDLTICVATNDAYVMKVCT
jgi:peroxiredoxin